MARLSVRNLEVVLPTNRAAFSAQSFELGVGEILGLLGPSGCGKSTLLRAVAGLIPSTGDVRLDGRTADEIGWPRFRRHVLYVHQRPLFLPGTVEDGLLRVLSYRSAREVSSASTMETGTATGMATETEAGDVRLTRARGSVPWPDTRPRAIELLAQVGLDASILSRPADSLSVGEGQRAALVRAFLIAPPVLLLDEPTSALDVGHRDRVEALLNDHVRHGGAAVLVTHDAAQAERLCASVRSVV
ncbi:MAG: ATP-binding cassette domain-containing protein [Deltaproteobacteria bacterium]|nr:ATP-binding cassette domain-containing protein [Deltaproteobacteria bacterium]